MDYNAKQRLYRKRINNVVTKRYEKTKKGFLVRLYRNMQSRVCGIQWTKKHLYENKELLSRSSFYNWALSSSEFNSLFDEWEKTGYPRRFTPSVDRVDSSKGYILDNMEWVPFHENCRRSMAKPVIYNGVKYQSLALAAKQNNLTERKMRTKIKNAEAISPLGHYTQ